MTSLQSIADRTGYSVETVSRVLRGVHKGERRDARERARQILKVATELGYRPNTSARAMRAGRFDAIGWIWSTRSHVSSVAGPLLFGVEEAADAHRLHIILSRLPDEMLSTDELPKMLRQLMTDGLLVSYTHEAPPTMELLLDRHRVPTIWINSLRDRDAVRPDDLNCGRLATEHLLKQGHRRIAYWTAEHSRACVESTQSHYSMTYRREGYRQAMRAAGLTPVEVTAEPGYDELGRRPRTNVTWAIGDDAPTAVVSYSGVGTAELYYTTRHADGRARIACVTFGPEPLDIDGMRFDTVVLPEQAIGAAAVNLLVKRIDQPQHPLPSVVLMGELVCGDPNLSASRV